MLCSSKRSVQIRFAFSLIELIAVLCILAISASGTLFLFSGFLSGANARSAQIDIEQLHHWARESSATGSVKMRFNLDAQAIAAKALDGREKQLILGAELQLIALLSDGARQEKGQFSVNYMSGGCRTYALVFRSTSSNEESCLLVCGPSGVVHEIRQNRHAADIQNRLAIWANAD